MVDRYISAAQKARQKCVEFRFGKIHETSGSMPTVVDSLVSDWKFSSRDDAARSRVMARRRDSVTAEYGARLDAILTATQMWI